jgi:hypothetical protein
MGKMVESLFDEILECKNGSELRTSLLICRTKDLNLVLKKFGLKPFSDQLIGMDWAEAQASLKFLLWRSLAYSSVETCPEEKAEKAALEIMNRYSTNESKFYSNGEWHSKDGKWTFSSSGLTDATFDAGLIIQNNIEYVCIWFEEED